MRLNCGAKVVVIDVLIGGGVGFVAELDEDVEGLAFLEEGWVIGDLEHEFIAGVGCGLLGEKE